MKNLSGARLLSVPLVCALALSTPACSSGDKGSSGCKTPEIVGDVFGASGTASVTGTGTLPDGIADGLEVGILVSSGNASYGVSPDNLFDTNDRVCGKGVRYTAKGLSAGTYRLAFDIFDPNSDSTQTVFEGTATSDFTVADGQMLHLDAVFQMTP